MIKIKADQYTSNKKQLLSLIKKTPEAIVKENSFFKTDSVLEKNVPRFYSDFFFTKVIGSALTYFCEINRHKKIEVLRFYKANMSVDNYIEWHVNSKQGQYECIFGVDTKGIEINYYDNISCENKHILLEEGEILFIPTNIPRGIDKVKKISKLIIFYLNIYEYVHKK